MASRPPVTELLDDMNVGDSLSLEVTLVSPLAPYGVIDLTGSTVKFGMRRQYLSTPTSPDQINADLVSTEPTEGKAFLFLSSEDTKDLSPGVYYYGFTLTDPAGDVFTIIEARLTMRPSISPITEGS